MGDPWLRAIETGWVGHRGGSDPDADHGHDGIHPEESLPTGDFHQHATEQNYD